MTRRHNPRATASLTEALALAVACAKEAKHYASARKFAYTADLVEEALSALRAAELAAYDEGP